MPLRSRWRPKQVKVKRGRPWWWPSRTEWGIVLVGYLILGWFAPHQPYWVTGLAAFVLGLSSKKLAEGVDKLLDH